MVRQMTEVNPWPEVTEGTQVTVLTPVQGKISWGSFATAGALQLYNAHG